MPRSNGPCWWVRVGAEWHRLKPSDHRPACGNEGGADMRVACEDGRPPAPKLRRAGDRVCGVCCG